MSALTFTVYVKAYRGAPRGVVKAVTRVVTSPCSFYETSGILFEKVGANLAAVHRPEDGGHGVWCNVVRQYDGAGSACSCDYSRGNASTYA